MKERTSRYRQPYYRRETLRFQCTACGACCRGDDNHHVFLSREEAEKICHGLGVSWAWFRRRYLAVLEDGERVLNSREDGRCVFLDGQGKCRIYDMRPAQCASYPFWPEVVMTAKGWRQEALRCEGIGLGPRVSARMIELELQK